MSRKLADFTDLKKRLGIEETPRKRTRTEGSQKTEDLSELKRHLGLEGTPKTKTPEKPQKIIVVNQVVNVPPPENPKQEAHKPDPDRVEREGDTKPWTHPADIASIISAVGMVTAALLYLLGA